jgi:hypothetical protein
MAQIFHRRSNTLARLSLLLAGLIVIVLGVTLDLLQRSPWVTRQGQRPEQPVLFSHKHHVQGLGLQCQYCHVSAETSSSAGIPPTKTCMNCHSEIWTNAEVLEPVRQSWASGKSIAWTKVNDLPDFVYFSHEIHVHKGVDCVTCHGRVDQMPVTYAQNTLQMEWCLDCHRNPAKYLRPTSEIYNVAWEKPSSERPVWCAEGGERAGTPTAENVSCVTKDPAKSTGFAAILPPALLKESGWKPGSGPIVIKRAVASSRGEAPPPLFQKFTSQDKMGQFLVQQYKIRTPKDLTSCEVCHR